MADRVARRGRAGAALAVAAVLLAVILLDAGPAAAQTVSASQLQALAERAVDDPRALAQLRAVREVDGRPVDMGRALAGAEGPALAARLRTLATADASAPPGVGATEARDDAAAILDGRRFKPPWVPRPFAGILRTIGGWLEPVVDPVRDLWRAVNRSLAAQLALVAVVFAVALAITLRLVGRRSPQSVHRSRRIGMEEDGLDPDELERQAAAAERDGDLDRAVRLRFVAGVLRLDQAGVISYRSSMTTGQLKAILRSGSFAELAAAFDEIVYGGRPAEPSDVAAATDVWPRVLAEARR
jgi:hypothetical protein